MSSRTLFLFGVALVATWWCLLGGAEASRYVQGAGKQFQEAHFAEGGQKKDEGYKGHQESEKGAKGEHSKSGLSKDFSESGGNQRGSHHQDGHYSQHHQAQKGAKGYDFHDHGHYAKGHSTRGRHDVHKLDEYKKKTDFFDEDLDEASKERHGAFDEAKGFKKSVYQGAGFHEAEKHSGKKAKEGGFEEGGFKFEKAGHGKKEGTKEWYENGEEFAKKGAEDGFKKFGFSHQIKH